MQISNPDTQLINFTVDAEDNNDGKDNVLLYMERPGEVTPSNFFVLPSNPPVSGYVSNYIVPTEKVSDFEVKFRINSKTGLDLDGVRVFIDDAELTVPSDSSFPGFAFRYGGRVDQNPTLSAVNITGEFVAVLPPPLLGNATFRINPVLNGVDEFIISGINLSRLPVGGHVLKVSPQSTVTLSQLEKSAAGETSKISLEKGKVFANAKKLQTGSTFEIKPPTAVAGVRGTGFECSDTSVAVFL